MSEINNELLDFVKTVASQHSLKLKFLMPAQKNEVLKKTVTGKILCVVPVHQFWRLQSCWELKLSGICLQLLWTKDGIHHWSLFPSVLEKLPFSFAQFIGQGLVLCPRNRRVNSILKATTGYTSCFCNKCGRVSKINHNEDELFIKHSQRRGSDSQLLLWF